MRPQQFLPTFGHHREGADVELIGLNQPSSSLLNRLGVHDKPEAAQQLGGH